MEEKKEKSKGFDDTGIETEYEKICKKWKNKIKKEDLKIPEFLLPPEKRKNNIKSLKTKEGDNLKLKQTEDKELISISNNKKIDLEELFKNYKGNNLAKEFEWDEPVGEELW